MKLENKVAIVTGGSRGIGYATVEKFIKEGAKVCLTASSEASAEKAVGKLKEAYPNADIMGIAPTLSSLESVQAEFAKVVEKYGRIDILINNAGMSESTPLSAYTEELYDKVIDLNVKGVFTCSKVAGSEKKPCSASSIRKVCTGFFASHSLLAYSSPSSRRGSHSAVISSAGGRLDKSSAKSGAK